MTEEQQRIVIAVACGFTQVCYGTGKRNGTFEKVPDYLNDLNAMHEARKVIKRLNLRAHYTSELRAIVGRDTKDKNRCDPWTWANATAKQHAEAFLRTIGKWEEQPEMAENIAI